MSICNMCCLSSRTRLYDCRSIRNLCCLSLPSGGDGRQRGHGMRGGRPPPPAQRGPPAERGQTHWSLIRLSDNFCLSICKDPSNYLKRPMLLSTYQSETTATAINVTRIYLKRKPHLSETAVTAVTAINISIYLQLPMLL